MNIKNADYWINLLELEKHPEGGYFRETYRSQDRAQPLKHFDESRSASTLIYYLLKSEDKSALHRLNSDEIWHFYAGAPICIHEIDSCGKLTQTTLGNPEQMHFHHIVPANAWFGATVTQPDTFSLVGCTVAPGFEFDDFELADKNQMANIFPQHHAIIDALT